MKRLFCLSHPEQGLYRLNHKATQPVVYYPTKVEAKVQRDKLNPPRTEEKPHSSGPWTVSFGPDHSRSFARSASPA